MLDGPRTVDEITAVSTAGRNPRHQPVTFALAACAAAHDPDTRARALAAVPAVCRTGTHLFLFAGYVEQFRGWGRGLRRAVADWYTTKDADALAYQLVKYQQRDGWSHRDLLRLAKPRPERDSATDLALRWAVGKADDDGTLPAATPRILHAHRSAQAASTAADVIPLITEHRLPWEALRSEHLAAPEVWQALIPVTGLGALVRNLGRMTANGTLAPGRPGTHAVLARLADTIVDALDDTFYRAFASVEPAGVRTLAALDVSGSMSGGVVAGVPGLTPRLASAAMAAVTLATEPEVITVAFNTTGDGAWVSPNGGHSGWGYGITPLPLSRRQRLDDILAAVGGFPFYGTDCSLPMLYALDRGLAVDHFVVYTDSETWAGDIHPAQALQRYRERTGIAARLTVVAMVSNGFTIADPADAGMLDVVGFDTAAPQLMADFAAGRL